MLWLSTLSGVGPADGPGLFRSKRSIGHDKDTFNGEIPLEAFVLWMTAVRTSSPLTSLAHRRLSQFAQSIRRYHTGVKSSSIQFTVPDYSATHANLRRILSSAIEQGKTPNGADFLRTLHRNIMQLAGNNLSIEAPRCVDTYVDEQWEV